MTNITDIDKWTLELVKRRIETGVKITPQVVDIGGGIIVKSGTTRVKQEAKTTKFVARSTNIRVPNIYAVLHDEKFGTSYIVEEKLPGVPLKEVLPHLDDATRTSLANELKGVFRELEVLNTRARWATSATPESSFVPSSLVPRSMTVPSTRPKNSSGLSLKPSTNMYPPLQISQHSTSLTSIAAPSSATEIWCRRIFSCMTGVFLGPSIGSTEAGTHTFGTIGSGGGGFVPSPGTGNGKGWWAL
ncbi:hypothetical protein R3P38DRAFT_1844649 [Favolaschia claudopus]|uniref:Aminoglycoside phosphotransferase domain-containing protein n=1 Tax=Favolaschia claudopus TaxID=2862362 RepID=A0AAW0A2Y1_9AGAR